MNNEAAQCAQRLRLHPLVTAVHAQCLYDNCDARLAASSRVQGLWVSDACRQGAQSFVKHCGRVGMRLGCGHDGSQSCTCLLASGVRSGGQDAERGAALLQQCCTTCASRESSDQGLHRAASQGDGSISGVSSTHAQRACAVCQHTH
jgi:hypothetical protein